MKPRTLAEYLRELVAVTAYSQEAVARHAGLSLRTIQNVARGEPYAAATAERLAATILELTTKASHDVDALLRDFSASGFCDDA